MAYSGLGAGTQADPYQITTVSQFKEMDNSAYAGVYFLLMNDLDFSEETGVSIASFYCKFDGNSKAVHGIEVPAAGFLNLQNNSSITNFNFIFTRVQSVDSPIFANGNYINTVTITNGVIVCRNKNLSPVKLIGGSVLYYWWTLSNLRIEGNFSRLFPYMYSRINGIKIYNTNGGHVPVIEEIGDGVATVDNCVYIKPFTFTAAQIRKGMIIQRGSARSTIRNTVVIVSEYIDDSGYYVFGVFIGGGYGTVTDCYAVGNFRTKSSSAHVLCGYPTDPDHCVFERDYYYGDFNGSSKNDTSIMSTLPSTGCKYCKELLSNQNHGDNYATNLSLEQFKQQANFSGWDFTNVWRMGSDRPLLISADESTGVFEPESILQTGTVSIGEVQRVSETRYSVEVITDNTADFGIDIWDAGILVETRISEKGTLYFDTSTDVDAGVKVYNLAGGVKIIAEEKTYYHRHLEQIAVTDVIVDKYVPLLASGNISSFVHGSVLVGQYLYGTPRASGVALNNSIAKVNADDVSQFWLFPILCKPGAGIWNMDSVCNIGNKLYSVALGTDYKNYMIVFDVETDTYQSYYIANESNAGAPSCTDGTYLYVYLYQKIWKIDVSVFNSESQFNVDTLWPIGSAYLSETYAQNPHTMVVDEINLYVGFGSGGDSYPFVLWKVLKTNMTKVSECEVPKMTDDMCQTDTHLFIGIEPNSSVSVGYNVGCVAIRKSDLRVTKLRKLHTTDTADVKSYASLIFGNYLIDLKTNSHIYTLDISDPDSWNNDDMGAHTLKVYKMLKPNGVTLTEPINEVCLTEDGKFVGFAWAATSCATSFSLQGLDYFSEPTVTTIDAAIVGDNDVSLAGFITNTGGKTVTAVGIILGQAADLSDGVDYPVTPVTAEFEIAFNGLEYGTYYFRVYASNAEGTGYGDIKSFTLEVPYTEPGQPTDLDKAIRIEITVNWTAPVDDGGTPITGYKIERKASDGDWAVVVADTESTETAYTETLPQGVYQYRVSAITAYATSQPSATLDVNAVVGGVGKYRIFLGSTEITTVE